MIKVYSHLGCSWCQEAKNFFVLNKIKFKEYDISLSDKAREEMLKKSGQLDVPVIEIGGMMIVGFNQNAMEIALQQMKNETNYL